MYSYLILTLCCSFLVVTFRRKVIKRIQDHENPKIQGIERIPIHSLLIGFVSDIDARNFVMQPRCSPYVQYLDGNWLFYLHQSFDDALAMLRRGTSAHTSTHLTSCTAPCQWQLLNCGDPPISTTVPFENVTLDNPAGYYQCQFEIPSEWERRQIRLVFGGVGSAFYVWVNGNFVGFSKDSKLSTEYNISQYAKIGRSNLLQLIVVKFSESSQLENHGAWKFSGIFREVYIMSLPQAVHIQDYNWIYTPNQTDSQIKVKIQLEWDAPSSNDTIQNQKHDYAQFQGGVYPRNNFLNSSAEWVVSTALYEEGVLMSSSPADSFESAQYFAFDNPKSLPTAKRHDYVFRPTTSSNEKTTNREDQNQDDSPSLYSFTSLPEESSPVSKKWISDITHHLSLKTPRKWSAETPFVYTLVIILRNATDGKIVQAESCRVALRTVDVKNGLLQVNSKPIMVRGVNILEYDSESANSFPHMLCEHDIQLMKRNNINAIRTPPHDPWIYELCTLYGIYIINEVNIHLQYRSLKVVDDPDWEVAYLTRLIRLYGRDKVHSSIIIWSLGNRSGYGKIHDKMAHWIRATDPTRLVMYEPASYGARPATNSLQNRQLATDILCPMYAQISDLITLANRYPDHPLILSEYALMTGNGGGNIEEYWNSFNDYRRLQGGFLSNWVDHEFTFDLMSTPLLTWGDHDLFGRIKFANSQFFSGVNWHERGQIHEADIIDDINSVIPHGLIAQLPHSGFSRARELQELGRIWVKPQLLEVKQCMKLFDCELVESKFLEGTEGSLIVSVKINISNFTDHIDDLSELLHFDGYLLCSGALVSVARFFKLTSSIIQHSGDDAGGRDMYQLITVCCEFVIPTEQWVGGIRIHGIHWPDDVLSIFTSNTSVLKKIYDQGFSNHIWVNPSLVFDWKCILLGRLASHMSWGSAGLPLGFKQMKLDKTQRLSWEQSSPSASESLGNNFSLSVQWTAGESEEPDICLSAVNSLSKIEAIVCSKTGFLLSYRVNDVNMLAPNDGEYLPSKFQLHRAPTANDHKGYLSAWKVAGLDQDMHHIPYSNHTDLCPLAGTNIVGQTNLRLVKVDRIYLHQRDDLQSGLEDPLYCCGEGVMCSWESTSKSMDRGKVLILDKVHKFVNDTSGRLIVVEVRSNSQEEFLYQLASLFRLGHEIVLSKEEELEEELLQDWNTNESSQSTSKDTLKIRLWKMTSFTTSTIPYVEAMESKPSGSLKYDHLDSDDGHSLRSRAYYDECDDIENEKQTAVLNFNCRKHFTVKWAVSYILDLNGNLLIRGEVDISNIPCPPARIGMQFRLPTELDYCTWYGNGPHENYQDRKASTVCAIHSAPAKLLYVPYAIPSENGGRSNTQWIKFSSNSSKHTPSFQIRCNPQCTFSAQPHSTEDLCRSLHSSELRNQSPQSLCVNIDPYMMAIGSDSCWSIAMSEKFTPSPSVHNFQFVISTSDS